MKISSGAPLSDLPRTRLKAAGGSKSPAFADVLEKTLSSLPAVRVSTILPAPPLMRPPPGNISVELGRTTERVLDAMEHYQKLLGDGGVTLRVVEPVVRELEKTILELTPLMESISADHPVLQVAHQTLLTAAKEIARFDQGQYVSDDRDPGLTPG